VPLKAVGGDIVVESKLMVVGDLDNMKAIKNGAEWEAFKQ
jgi:hypothetical protein